MLKESIEKSLKDDLRGAVLFLDLDNFKTVNDTYGHLTGDELLKDVAELLKFFETDNIKISRFGGDEFVILVHDIENEEYVTELASNIVKALNRPWFIKEKEFYNTVSIGIVFYPDHECDVESILSNADFAMYSVKKAGKDNFRVYSRNMNSSLVERVDMENNLRYALKRREFILHYQPQIHQRTGDIVGVEALIRWNHPINGLVSPKEFIPIAEETGLIVPIGEWVLKEACRQNKAWQDMGYSKFCISVNLSAQQLKQPDLVNNIRSILRDTELEAKWLCLEITESIAISDIEFAVKLLRDLREIGVEIALDDFGCGYSSLTYLKMLPINIVKIDRSFIADIQSEEDTKNMTNIIILMARQLGINVIAEGVETKHHLNYLRKHGCEMFQGYLVCKPVPKMEFFNLFKLQEDSDSGNIKL
jgi:diguanylate cyclase (GGDEF)-like protein